MRSLLNAACGWLKEAKNAQKTAEQLTDREAKRVMAELGQMYLLRAQIALIQTTGLEFSRPDPHVVIPAAPSVRERLPASSTAVPW